MIGQGKDLLMKACRAVAAPVWQARIFGGKHEGDQSFISGDGSPGGDLVCIRTRAG